MCFRCLHPTKTHLLHSDMDWGRSIHVPAQFHFRQWQPAKPRTGTSIVFPLEGCLLHCCRNLDLFGYLQLVQLHLNLPQSKDVEKFYFALNFTLDQPIFLAVFKGLFCAREMHSTTKFAMLFLSKCVSACEVIVCVRCCVRKLCVRVCVKLLYVKCDKVVCVTHL